MYRICQTKDGKLIESQSGGYDPPEGYKFPTDFYRAGNLDTLRNNAVNAGYSETDIEVKFVTDEEFATIMAAQRESELTYADRRRAEYPLTADLNDALVKQRSSDPAIVAEGQAQEIQYYSDCLAVKARHPK